VRGAARKGGPYRNRYAEVGAQLACDGASMLTSRGAARTVFDASHARIHGNLLMRHGFLAEGGVELGGAVIDDQLSVNQGRFRGSVDLDGLRARELVLLPIEKGLTWVLANVAVDTLCDLRPAWPEDCYFDNLTYRNLRFPWSLSERLSWVAASRHGYVPDAYDQFAAFIDKQPLG
jgi:hypothetical protein